MQLAAVMPMTQCLKIACSLPVDHHCHLMIPAGSSLRPGGSGRGWSNRYMGLRGIVVRGNGLEYATEGLEYMG